MDARALGNLSRLSEERPLIARLDGMQHGNDSSNEHEPTDARLVQMLAEFFRGGKEKRKQMLQPVAPHEVLEENEEDVADKYEPQRLTRKIHWQYDRSMKRVPMLRRDYIG